MKKYILLLVVICLFSCKNENPVIIPITNDKFTIVDDKATEQTHNLLVNLKSISKKGAMFGQQCSTLYGLGWYGDKNRSDIKTVCGNYPAINGWEIGGIELGNTINLDKDKFDDIRSHIIAAYQRGGVNTITWHANNPATNGNAWDKTQAVNTIIPGGINHEKYKMWLDKIADFMLTLKDSNNHFVPVLFRPFHEFSGDGFWWGKGNCTSEEYIALWKFTITYLRDTKGVHNILYVYSSDIVNTQAQYLDFWPGDEYVDVLGIDAYDRPSWNFEDNCLQLTRLLNHIGILKNKPIALTETGLQNNTNQASWWTQKLLKVLITQPVSYVMVWRNENTNDFFGPYPGCISEADFLKFSKSDKIILENNLPKMY